VKLFCGKFKVKVSQDYGDGNIPYSYLAVGEKTNVLNVCNKTLYFGRNSKIVKVFKAPDDNWFRQNVSGKVVGQAGIYGAIVHGCRIGDELHSVIVLYRKD
jgi:hypothetical protein